MLRRRRRIKEIPFSFDSFLDIVANVVGIIIRLILVVWVGARSYNSVRNDASPSAGQPVSVDERMAPADPFEAELARQRQELDRAEERLLQQLRKIDETHTAEEQFRNELTNLSARIQGDLRQREDLTRTANKNQREVEKIALSAKTLKERSARLKEELLALEKQSPVHNVHHYRTPISRNVQSEELFFECKRGRVTYIDVAALLAQVRQNSADAAETLKTEWQVMQSVPAVGAFKLRYVLERERGILDGLGAGSPGAGGGFRYTVAEWTVEPVITNRGESVDAALRPGSEFRQIADHIDARITTVTMWVYPDSFPLYRQVRDYLYEKDVVVAGRPLPEGVEIMSSRRGTASRGQ